MQFRGSKGLSGEGSEATGSFGGAEVWAGQVRRKRAERMWEQDRGQGSKGASVQGG